MRVGEEGCGGGGGGREGGLGEEDEGRLEQQQQQRGGERVKENRGEGSDHGGGLLACGLQRIFRVLAQR